MKVFGYEDVYLECTKNGETVDVYVTVIAKGSYYPQTYDEPSSCDVDDVQILDIQVDGEPLYDVGFTNVGDLLMFFDSVRVSTTGTLYGDDRRNALYLEDEILSIAASRVEFEYDDEDDYDCDRDHEYGQEDF